MPAADLSRLFRPRAIALIGASADAASISARPLRMLQESGYAGALLPINPKYTELRGLPVLPSIGAAPGPVDTALIAVPAPLVPAILEECAAAGVQFAVVFSAGFTEAGASGTELQHAIADVVARTGLRVAGPNCEGYFYAASNVCATFSPSMDPELGYVPGPAGPIAVISQSGGLGFALLNRGRDMGLTFGAVVSTGNEVDLSWLDYADWLLDDPNIRIVLGLVEEVRHAERLVSVAQKAVRLNKQVVIARIGRSAAGQQAATSHTGSLAGNDAVYSAAFRQLGIMQVDDTDEMLDAALYFTSGRLPAGRRLGVLTISGGAGAWLADAAAARGFEMPAPPAAVQTAIRAFIPAYGSVANPVDLSAQAAFGGGFERALGLLAEAPDFDAIMGVCSLVREERFRESVPDLRRIVSSTSRAIAFFSYTRPSLATLETLAELGIPCYPTPVRAARALAWATAHAEFRRSSGDIRVLAEAGLDTADPWPAPATRLTEVEARTYLAPLGIPGPAGDLVTSATAAVEQFTALGGQPVALKVQSPDLLHKTDVGGVRLGLGSADDVRAAYMDLLTAVRQARPDASVEGVLVQRMAPPGIEVILGARRDPHLGAVVLLGLGGVHVDLLGDVALRLAPVSAVEARAMLEELRGARLLHGVRGQPAADVEALTDAVVRFSELAARLPPAIAAVELNPLLVLPVGQGVLMLDAAIELDERRDGAGG